MAWYTYVGSALSRQSHKYSFLEKSAPLFCSDLVVSRLGDVPDPGQRLIARLLDDLQVPDLDPGRCEVRDLVLDFDGGLAVDRLRFYRGQAEAGSHQVFLKRIQNAD